MLTYAETEATATLTQLRADLAAGHPIQHAVTVGESAPSALSWAFTHGDTGYMVDIAPNGGLYVIYEDGKHGYADVPSYVSIEFDDLAPQLRAALRAIVESDEDAAEDVRRDVLSMLAD